MIINLFAFIPLVHPTIVFDFLSTTYYFYQYFSKENLYLKEASIDPFNESNIILNPFCPSISHSI